ncbi:DUF4358 domain-containing protein [Aminipila terrae]|uniref:DUF4358 domain-containing protein n=1 Tax=Aminipila terrae TaxID=2697030 RepID=A0A6P1MDR0_9FIRM|nr:DUF4358 domain-containing protein [Aminipila terrae]QHI72819.1 DUF4358 domain-containing protein [Aminipila terrae]
MRNLKLCVIMVLVICAVFTGCNKGGSKETAGNEQILEQAKVSDLGEYIVKNTQFKDYMSKVDNDIFFSLYNLNKDLVDDAVLYSSTGATAEEVAVIKAVDGKTEDVVKACKDRIQAQKEGFENYVPEELDKLSKPVIKTFGNTVVLVVCNDSDAADKLLANYDSKEI